MKDVIIFGANDFGRLMKFYFEDDNDPRQIVAFTMDSKYIVTDSFLGLPIVAFENIEEKYSPEFYEILIAIGNSKMNQVRETVFNRCKEKGYTLASFVHSTSHVHSDISGEGNIVLEECLIYPFAKIGQGNLLWDHVLISHDCVVGNFNTFSSYADLCGYVSIGNNGYFGKHCILNDRTKIADYTLVGADAYVKKDTEPYDVVVPARSVVLDRKKSIDIM